MGSQNRYRGVIWTNHALERLKQRNLSQDRAYAAFATPDARYTGKKKHTVEYQKKDGIHLITLIATQNEQSEWIILSCWVDPPMPGSIDIGKKKLYNEYRRASVWKKMWMNVLKQLGINRF